MNIYPSLMEKTTFKSYDNKMRGGLQIFSDRSGKPLFEQYGGLAVPFGLNINHEYTANQISYNKFSDNSQSGGGITPVLYNDDETDNVVSDKLFQSLFFPIVKSQRGGTEYTQRSKENVKPEKIRRTKRLK